MVSLEQWKEYVEHIDELNEEIRKENSKVWSEWYERTLIKNKFLWWEWTTRTSSAYLFPPYQRGYIQKSVEGCLNYFLEKQV